MTVLSAFQRLESLGNWQSAPSEPMREVFVQLGEATLTISDSKMIAICHWSLPAVQRLNPGEDPARYATGDDSPEVLEVDDPLMVGALEKVLSSLARRAQPRKLRRSVLLGGAALALIIAAIVIPKVLVSEALSVAPFAKRAEIGEALLREIRKTSGAQCDDPLGRRALERLRIRLLPDSRGRIVVLREGLPQGQFLPGGLLLVSNAMLNDYDDPAVLAGHVLALDEAARRADPLETFLHDVGAIGTFQLLTTGELAPRHIVSYASDLLKEPPKAPPSEALIARLTTADVPVGPYAAALGDKGKALQDAPPLPPGKVRPVLADEDWVALQQICGE